MKKNVRYKFWPDLLAAEKKQAENLLPEGKDPYNCKYGVDENGNVVEICDCELLKSLC